MPSSCESSPLSSGVSWWKADPALLLISSCRARLRDPYWTSLSPIFGARSPAAKCFRKPAAPETIKQRCRPSRTSKRHNACRSLGGWVGKWVVGGRRQGPVLVPPEPARTEKAAHPVPALPVCPHSSSQPSHLHHSPATALDADGAMRQLFLFRLPSGMLPCSRIHIIFLRRTRVYIEKRERKKIASQVKTQKSGRQGGTHGTITGTVGR